MADTKPYRDLNKPLFLFLLFWITFRMLERSAASIQGYEHQRIATVEGYGFQESDNHNNVSSVDTDMLLATVNELRGRVVVLEKETAMLKQGQMQGSPALEGPKTRDTAVSTEKPIQISGTNVQPVMYTAINHAQEFTDVLDPNQEYTVGDSFCVPWTTNSDEWWAHHPEWEIGTESPKEYCFQKIKDPERLAMFTNIYKVQFHGDDHCNPSNVYTKRVWNSGWAADFLNIIDGLNYVNNEKKPIQMEPKPWHYADPSIKNQNGTRACPSSDMFCYFLPLSNCKPKPEGEKATTIKSVHQGNRLYQLYYEYASRQQTWLRKRVFDFIQQQQIDTPCTVMHVRRGDIVLHHKFSRQYHPISDYIEAANKNAKIRPNVFLLTDDKNALSEARVEFPNITWQYIERPRFRGTEGGWERQIPSDDATFEVTALLAELKLAQRCDQIIHGKSGFSEMLYHSMTTTGQRIHHVNLADPRYRKKGAEVFNVNNSQTVIVSKRYSNSRD